MYTLLHFSNKIGALSINGLIISRLHQFYFMEVGSYRDKCILSSSDMQHAIVVTTPRTVIPLLKIVHRMDFLISQFPFLISLLYLCHKPKNYSYTDMKKIALLLLMLLPFGVAAQKQQDMSKYLAGAVTEQNGIVVFEK